MRVHSLRRGAAEAIEFWKKFNQEYVDLIERYKKYLPVADVPKADAEIRKLLLEEKIVFGRIESINGNFNESRAYFKEARKLYPAVIFKPRFIFEFLKATVYMPIRKKL